MSHPKINRQPLGSEEDLAKIIEAGGDMPQEETRALVIIYARSKLEMDVPVKWTVNKVKVMLCVQFEMLVFDKFQLSYNNYLIPGQTLISSLSHTTLTVVQAQSLHSFNQYYMSQMKPIIHKYHLYSTNTLYPVAHKKMFAMACGISGERQKNFEPLVQRPRREEGQGINIMTLLRVIGLAFLTNIIFSFASYGQMAVLFAVVLLYLAIDNHVQHNNVRRRRQRERDELQRQQANIRNPQNQQQNIQNNQNLPQNQQIPQNPQNNARRDQLFNLQNINLRNPNQNQKPQMQQNPQKPHLQHQMNLPNPQPKRNNLKAKLLLNLAFICQFLYCYLLSIFPNWTVETHLHANQERMDKVMDQLKELDPQGSELVKNWQKAKGAERQHAQRQGGQVPAGNNQQQIQAL